MKIGTKSVLFGAHQFLIHPIFLTLSWCRLFGPPLDPRLWFIFLVHDLGYWGLPNMDGDEGEAHVEFGANIVRKLFGDEWGDLCLYHSRFYAQKNEHEISKLCVADKYAIVLMPTWMFVVLSNLSGEICEYKEKTKNGKYNGHSEYKTNDYEWFVGVKHYIKQWVMVNSKKNVKNLTKIC